MVSCVNSIANKNGIGRLSGLAKSFLGGFSSCYRIKKDMYMTTQAASELLEKNYLKKLV